MVSAIDDHEALNQSPPLAGLNLFTSDPALSALIEGLPLPVVEQLTAHGAASVSYTHLTLPTNREV